MTKDQAMQIIEDKLSAKGISKACWGFADSPSRLVYLVRDPRGGKKN